MKSHRNVPFQFDAPRRAFCSERQAHPRPARRVINNVEYTRRERTNNEVFGELMLMSWLAQRPFLYPA